MNDLLSIRWSIPRWVTAYFPVSFNVSMTALAGKIAVGIDARGGKVALGVGVLIGLAPMAQAARGEVLRITPIRFEEGLLA